jgi:hypothetical protein
MTDDRFERFLHEVGQDYHRPPATPRDELWRRIVATRAARAARRRPLLLRPAWGWGLGLAAMLALGIAIGRSTGPTRPASPASTDLAYRITADQYLTRTEALLTGFRAAGRTNEAAAAQLAGPARELLATTRLILDSPAAKDARLRSLLEDLELVLAEIAQLPVSGDPESVQLINQGLEQRSVLLRLRTATPTGPSPIRTEGVL